MNNQPEDRYTLNQKQLKRFRILAIFIGYIVIEILVIPLIALGLIFIANIEPKEVATYFENKNFLLFLAIPIQTILAGYFFTEIKRAKIDLRQIIGLLNKIDFKLPIGLAIANYLFASGSSTVILYGLSFLIPSYVEMQLNQTYATTTLGYVCFAIAVLIFAPIMEELFFRGIIFQKIAVQKGTAKALLWSSFIFAIVHFRSDLISLFALGLSLALLYLKTKQIIVPIICHFFYNLIVTLGLIYWDFFSGVNTAENITIADFQQDFIDGIEYQILFIALSLPYICYFIYRNFPRQHYLERLPYFTNQKVLDKLK